MCSFLLLLGSSVVYFYIFVRMTAIYLNFYALLTSTLAFYFLFIGSGNQMVYQKKVTQTLVTYFPDGREKDRKNRIDFSKTKHRQDKWLWGIFFYSQAIPLSLVSIVSFYVEMPFWYGQDDK